MDGSSAALEPQLDNKPIGRSAPVREPVAGPVGEERSGGGGSSALAAVALIIALAGVGAAAFLYNQWQATRVKLVDADSRIAELEKRFEMSDEESSASVEVLNAKVKDNASEIRKLWGVSYDTNRKDIASNKSAAASAAKSAAAVKKELATLSGKVNGLSASVNKIAAVESALAELRKSNTTSQRDTKDALAKMERQLASVRTELTARVGANEEAVESIDAYRRSVNKDIVQLREAIRSLQGGSTASSM